MIFSLFRFRLLQKIVVADYTFLQLIKVVTDLLPPLSEPFWSVKVLTPCLRNFYDVHVYLVEHLRPPCVAVHVCFVLLKASNRRILPLATNKVKVDF